VRVLEQTAKVNRFLAPLVAVLGAAAWFQPQVTGSDLWWHLASGREIWADLAVHTTDPFSYTFQGRTWINNEWLWDAIYWAAYRVHPQVVAWLHLGVIVATFSLTYVISRRASGSRLAAGAMLWLVAATAHWYLDIRPHVFTLLLVNVFLLTRQRPWAPWLWPPLVVAWTNLHGGFVFGVGAIGLYVLERTITSSIRKRRLVVAWREWISVALCLAAMLANPHGYRILEGPLAYLDADSPFRAIKEWQSTGFSLDLHDFAGRFWLVAVVAALGVPLCLRRDRYLLALAAVTFAMAFNSRRFIPLFVITAAPMGALAIAWARERIAGRFKPLARPEVGLACSAAAGVAAAVLWLNVRIHPMLLERWTTASVFPEASLRYLKAMGTPMRILNHYNWGGYIMLHAPEMKVFIDGRANTLYDEEIYLDYLAFLAGKPGIHARADRYPADAALLPAGGRFARALGSGPGAWRVVYSNTVASILLPPDSPLLGQPLPDPAVVLSDHPDHALYLEWMAARRGDLDEARRHCEQALKLDPLLVRAYGQLAMNAAVRNDPEGIASAIATGIREVPRRSGELRRLEGAAYERIGDPHRALAAYRRAIPRGPFTDPRWMKEEIRRLEAITAREPGRHGDR
jgi:tetratricopeptide (TPR) repeat protein